MLRAVTAIFSLFILSGCAILLEEAALVDAGAGVSASEPVAMGIRGAAASETIVISDDMGASLRSVRFNPAIRGTLADSLSQITEGGERAITLRISPSGAIEGNGYTVARLGRNGLIYAPRGARLGLISQQGRLLEYTRTGELQHIGYVRGVTTYNVSPVFGDSVSKQVIGRISPGSFVRIWRVENEGYWVSLETGESGWLPGLALASLAILGADQHVATCGHETGAVVTKSGHLYQFSRCDDQAEGLDLVSEGRILHVPRDAVSEIWRGHVGGNGSPSVRGAIMVSLRTSGTIYPPENAYTLFPEGDPRSHRSRTPNLQEAPE